MVDCPVEYSCLTVQSTNQVNMKNRTDSGAEAFRQGWTRAWSEEPIYLVMWPVNMLTCWHIFWLYLTTFIKAGQTL